MYCLWHSLACVIINEDLNPQQICGECHLNKKDNRTLNKQCLFHIF